MFYDIQNRRYACKKCGLYLTREELFELKYKMRTPEEDQKRKKAREQSDYLRWWLSGNKEK
jgi:transcription initiation factor TFIIIB Brf1 subunit/transcription initiation factor TFIIB